jgi:arsenate reductase (thioredoxin)
MNTDNPFKILFLCTGNSARSIMAEYLIRRVGQNRFQSFSAGSNPKGVVHPAALRVLKDLYKIDASDASSKGMDQFKDVKFDFVITVCDNARESCPVWPGQPLISHWSSEDPTTTVGTEDQIFNAFRLVAQQIYRRLDLFCSLPFEKIDKLRVQELMGDISFVGRKMTVTQEIPTV